jgi:hypothetical protein
MEVVVKDVLGQTGFMMYRVQYSSTVYVYLPEVSCNGLVASGWKLETGVVETGVEFGYAFDRAKEVRGKSTEY